MPTIYLRQADDAASLATARALFQEYAEAIGTSLEYQGFSAELAALPQPYAPPTGTLLIARVDGNIAGCVGLRPLGDGAGEMKRLYVRPAFRGVALGKHMVEAVILHARQAGHRELRLDTLPSMTSAQALYRKLGFVEIGPYHDNYLPGTRFYSLDLQMAVPARVAPAATP
ncbi:GNAT family N-acetyltransferase [Steroidobacter sp. S1-65]|uniref:GNAT family N-acetyltransferase n=1 Tax=Steroidobacter gossypii TaxID=2805490 RepID=A0ABS1X274_9GAMM|nr:GNAT family N-acetyltransferase [Steroidobacter gossypii]MBM0107313.1 GNAT family N-acetyltransferase [Steroidobacter gossypii]